VLLFLLFRSPARRGRRRLTCARHLPAHPNPSRRLQHRFLKHEESHGSSSVFRRAGTAAAAAFAARAFGLAPARAEGPAPKPESPLFRISMAEWSLHKALFAKRDRSPGFSAGRQAGLRPERDRTGEPVLQGQGHGTGSTWRRSSSGLWTSMSGAELLIMIDGEGALGDPDLKRSARRRWRTITRGSRPPSSWVPFHPGERRDQQRGVVRGTAEARRGRASGAVDLRQGPWPQRDRREPRPPLLQRRLARRRDAASRDGELRHAARLR
jgi:hypothetical protein